MPKVVLDKVSRTLNVVIEVERTIAKLNRPTERNALLVQLCEGELRSLARGDVTPDRRVEENVSERVDRRLLVIGADRRIKVFELGPTGIRRLHAALENELESLNEALSNDVVALV